MDKEETLQLIKSLIKEDTPAEDLAVIESLTKEVSDIYDKETKATNDYNLLRDKFVKNIVEGNFGSGDPVENKNSEPPTDEEIVKAVLSQSK